MPRPTGGRGLDAPAGSDLADAQGSARVLWSEHEQERAAWPQLERTRGTGAEQLGGTHAVPEQPGDHEPDRLCNWVLRIVDIRAHRAARSVPGEPVRSVAAPVAHACADSAGRPARARLDKPVAAYDADREAQQIARAATAADAHARVDPRRPAAQRPRGSAGRIVGAPVDRDAPALGEVWLGDRHARRDGGDRAPRGNGRGRDRLAFRADRGGRVERPTVGADAQPAWIHAPVQDSEEAAAARVDGDPLRRACAGQDDGTGRGRDGSPDDGARRVQAPPERASGALVAWHEATDRDERPGPARAARWHRRRKEVERPRHARQRRIDAALALRGDAAQSRSANRVLQRPRCAARRVGRDELAPVGEAHVVRRPSASVSTTRGRSVRAAHGRRRGRHDRDRGACAPCARRRRRSRHAPRARRRR